jgi:hypothetical protein
VGRDFWEAAKFLLLAIEDDLSRWCTVKLELEEKALALLLTPQAGTGQRLTLTLPALTLEDMDDLVDLDKQRRIWGNWHGREQEFYRACAELVAPLNWSEVLAICGPETQARARLAHKAYRRMTSTEIPARLRMGSFTIMEANPDSYHLYLPGIGMDAFKLSARVTRLLPNFDGRPTTDIVNQIVETEGLRFTDELLGRLVDFKILEAVEM